MFSGKIEKDTAELIEREQRIIEARRTGKIGIKRTVQELEILGGLVRKKWGGERNEFMKYVLDKLCYNISTEIVDINRGEKPQKVE